MKKKSSLVFAFLSGLFLSHPAAAQRLEVSLDGKTNFGKYPAKERKEAVFDLKNSGGDILKIIGIRKTCGCAEFELSKNELKPGESAKFTAAIAANSTSGPYSKNIYIESNTPGHRFTTINLSGDAVPIFKVYPSDKLHVGTIPSESEWRQEFLLEPSEPGVEFGDASLESSLPAERSLTRKKDGSCALSLKLTPDPGRSGSFKCKVLVPVTKPVGWKPVEIIISGSVSPSAASKNQNGGKGEKEKSGQNL